MSEISLLDKLEEAEISLSSLKDRKKHLNLDLEGRLETVDKLNKELETLGHVISFFNLYSEASVSKVKSKIEEIVNSGLKSIFGTDAKLVIQSRQVRNSTEFYLGIDRGGEVSALKEKHGGGLLAVISFLFKIVFLIVRGNTRLALFDENLTFVSESYQKPLSQFIHKLGTDMGVNIVLISHQPLMGECADRVYVTRKRQGFTSVQIKN